MRWLRRSLLFWAISVPIFYLFILPFLMDQLAKKAQDQAYTGCKQQLIDQGLTGSTNSPITAPQSEKYCHCVSDGLILTKKDVFDLVQHKPATDLNTLAQAVADTCTAELHKEMFNGNDPAAAIENGPAPVAPPAPVPTPDPALIHL
jgi:hypothetical protein